MSAIRSKLASLGTATTWPRLVSPSLPLRIRARCLATATSPKADRAPDENQGSEKPEPYLKLGERRYFYAPRAYEPSTLSYADILNRALVPTFAQVRAVGSKLNAALLAGLQEPRDQ